MTIVLVGRPADRARLRASLNGAVHIVGEFPTLGAARAARVPSDAILLVPGTATEEGDVAPEPLTPREIEVLELLAEGLPNKTIAARLGISTETVKFHIGSIAGKLDAANRTDAVRRAVRRGLITL